MILNSTGSVWDALFIHQNALRVWYICMQFSIQRGRGNSHSLHSVLFGSSRLSAWFCWRKEGSLLIHWWAGAQQCIQGKREVGVRLHIPASSGSDMSTPPSLPPFQGHTNNRNTGRTTTTQWQNEAMTTVVWIKEEKKRDRKLMSLSRAGCVPTVLLTCPRYVKAKRLEIWLY